MRFLLNITDLKYAGILSTRLERFSVKAHSPYRANFRCPICGDSQKNKMKARGWILEKEKIAIIYCHNCNVSHNMRSYLLFIAHIQFNDYVIHSPMELGKKLVYIQSTRL